MAPNDPSQKWPSISDCSINPLQRRTNHDKMAMVEPASNDACHAAWESAVHAVALACQESNPRFDLDRFISACSYDWWKTHKRRG